MLRSRIFRRVQFEPMTRATVLEVIPRYHPAYATTPADVIAEIDVTPTEPSGTGPASPTA
jgi:hypothetical protein